MNETSARVLGKTFNVSEDARTIESVMQGDLPQCVTLYITPARLDNRGAGTQSLGGLRTEFDYQGPR